jgi:DNA-binding transcriptional MerR regulator
MTIKEVSEKYGVTQDTLRYYERVGMIPRVTRTAGGIRDYMEKDLEWVELAVCMRNAGLPVEAMIEYVKLSQIGDSTFGERMQLLKRQREVLMGQKRQMEETLERLNFKISLYEAAMETGKLTFLKDK